jgi:hypothetical protein
MMSILVSFPTRRSELFFSNNVTEEFNGSLHNQILLMVDVFDDYALKKIIEKYGRPRYVIGTLSYYKSEFDISVYTAPIWIETELARYKSTPLVYSELQNLQTLYTANFQVNKKQINRFLAIKFCEIFEVDVNYTWSGIGKDFDLEHIVKEQNNIRDPVIEKYWANILSPISKFKQKWIQWEDLDEAQSNGSSIPNYGENSAVWNNGLHNIVSSTAISLITESIWTQQAMTFTEKTVYAIAGLTFPVWVGGYRAATEWKNKGFDIFEDIIDHSYECMPTLIERCFYAFYLNKHILTNLELAKRLREENMSRLLSNRAKLTSDTFREYNRKIIKTWPLELQDPALQSLCRHLPYLNK